MTLIECGLRIMYNLDLITITGITLNPDVVPFTGTQCKSRQNLIVYDDLQIYMVSVNEAYWFISEAGCFILFSDGRFWNKLYILDTNILAYFF